MYKIAARVQFSKMAEQQVSKLNGGGYFIFHSC